jgi:hypothetical protein
MLLPAMPSDLNAQCQIFLPTVRGNGTTLGATPWMRPPGCSMVFFLLHGPGGPGGGGASGASGSPRGGGGGGGGGAVLRMLIPAMFLPEVLFMRPGAGSPGGLADAVGITSGGSYIWLDPAGTANPLGGILAGVSVAVGNGGLTGGFGTATAGGAGGLTNSASSLMLTQFGINSGGNGGGGTAGGAHTGAAGAAGFPAYNISMGGTGGAGCTTTDFAGGNQGPTINAYGRGTAPGGTGGGGNGVDGIGTHMHLDVNQFRRERTNMMWTGGTGGGSNNLGTGGKGGKGGIGQGGGGGGAGLIGGQGGDGGDGFIFVAAW